MKWSTVFLAFLTSTAWAYPVADRLTYFQNWDGSFVALLEDHADPAVLYRVPTLFQVARNERGMALVNRHRHGDGSLVLAVSFSTRDWQSENPWLKDVIRQQRGVEPRLADVILHLDALEWSPILTDVIGARIQGPPTDFDVVPGNSLLATMTIPPQSRDGFIAAITQGEGFANLVRMTMTLPQSGFQGKYTTTLLLSGLRPCEVLPEASCEH